MCRCSPRTYGQNASIWWTSVDSSIVVINCRNDGTTIFSDIVKNLFVVMVIHPRFKLIPCILKNKCPKTVQVMEYSDLLIHVSKSFKIPLVYLNVKKMYVMLFGLIMIINSFEVWDLFFLSFKRFYLSNTMHCKHFGFDN